MTSFIRSTLARARPDSEEMAIHIGAKIYIKDRNFYRLTARSGRDFRSFSEGDGNSELWETRIKNFLSEVLHDMGLTMQDVGILTYDSEFTRLQPLRHNNGYRSFNINCTLFRTARSLDYNDLPF